MQRMTYLRPNVETMTAYTPGEQPRVDGLIKLNTNENPYPPSSHVAAAVREAIGDGGPLRLYPDPASTALRERIAGIHGVSVDQVIVGNGSDDLLTLAMRAFVGEGQKVAYAVPSYSLYAVL